MTETEREELARLIERVLQRVMELPDRTSPDDWPEAMLVTGQELSDILGEEAAGWRPPAAAPSPVGQPAEPEVIADARFFARAWDGVVGPSTAEADRAWTAVRFARALLAEHARAEAAEREVARLNNERDKDAVALNASFQGRLAAEQRVQQAVAALEDAIAHHSEQAELWNQEGDGFSFDYHTKRATILRTALAGRPAAGGDA